MGNINWRAPFNARAERLAIKEAKENARSPEEQFNADWKLVVWRRKVIGHYERRPTWERHWLKFSEAAEYYAECHDGSERKRLDGYRRLIDTVVQGGFGWEVLLVSDGWGSFPGLSDPPESNLRRPVTRLSGDVLKAIRKAGFHNAGPPAAGTLRRPIVDDELIGDFLQFCWLKREAAKRWCDSEGVPWNHAWGKPRPVTQPTDAAAADKLAIPGSAPIAPPVKVGRPPGSGSHEALWRPIVERAHDLVLKGAVSRTAALRSVIDEIKKTGGKIPSASIDDDSLMHIAISNYNRRFPPS